MDPPPVQYVTTSDGYNIAYCVAGEGWPVVFMPQPTSHIQVYWTEDTWVRPWLYGLAERFQLVQYDGRGQGMSSRGLSADFRFEDLTRDLDAVVNRLGLERFVIVAVQSFGHIAVRYAVEHSDLVAGLVLCSCPMSLSDWPLRMLAPLAETDWDGLLRMLAGLSKAADVSSSVQRQKQSSNQQDWLAFQRAMANSTIAESAPALRTPVLLLHPRESLNLPPEESMKLAAVIPKARLMLIDGSTPLGDASQGIEAISDFVASLSSAQELQGKKDAARDAFLPLSDRELEVLRLVVSGKSNQQIADDLVISLNTVRRHVSNIFVKTGATNRAGAAIYARDHGLA